MRRAGLAVLAAVSTALLSSGLAHAQATFEGVIVYSMSGGGMSMDITQSVKGTHLRQEMQGPMGAMVQIMNTETMDMTMLMPAQKMYMTMNMETMMAQAQQQMKGPQPKPADFKSTGEKETIAGHACEHVAYKAEGMEIDMCVASGLGYMPFASPTMGGRQGGGSPLSSMTDIAAWKARFPSGYLPLSLKVTSEGQTMTMRASKVEKKSISADLFKVPDGYTKMPGPGGA